MAEILQIPSPLVAGVWPQALPHLMPAIEMSRGCFEPEDVEGLCVSGGLQLWLAVEDEDVLAAYVTEIVQYPRKRRVRAVFAGGKPHTMEKWLEPMVAAIERWSKEWGCSGIEATGRKGWTKVVDGEVVGAYLCRDYPAGEMH